MLYLKQERPGSRRDLWIQSLDGLRHTALTDSGRLAGWNRHQVEGPLNGACISPDGTRVAYAERHPVASDRAGLAPVQAWNVLLVVNADGTGRRILVDLRELPSLPEGTRASSFIWSSDGNQLAYALELPGPGCELLKLYRVDAGSGQVTDVPLNPTQGKSQLLVWSAPRNELVLTLQCGSTGAQRLGVLDVSTGHLREHPAEWPAVSPDGAHALVATPAPAGRKASLLTLDDAFTPESSLGTFTGRLNWYNQRPGGLFTAVTPEPPTTECAGVTPPPRRFHRWDPQTRTHPLVRQDATAFTVLAFSPDDTQALVNILVGRDDSQPGFCGEGWLQRLHLVQRDDLESDLPREQLLARSTPLGPSTPWPGPSHSSYIGWLH
ncbi:TolB family protein [Corallococcus carmarthensis]|uniref:TolB family protein n=1 Tax=Corallococcus carmarthensis TaxID=2316728 RepID=UPI00148C31C7|nr:hypothetical protein [Corallococcus carmarthensis]NOK17359.1 hypothetical protein [Corallococcus carmarthensis]